jgi:hypothetical protein
MLALKAEESIFELFLWEDGQFRFLEGELPAYEMVPISLNVTSVTLEGIRRVDEWARIRHVIPSAQCVPVSVRDLLGGDRRGAARGPRQVNDDRTVEICRRPTPASTSCPRSFPEASSGRLKRCGRGGGRSRGGAWQRAAEMVAEAAPASRAGLSRRCGGCAPPPASSLTIGAARSIKEVEASAAAGGRHGARRAGAR